AVQPRRCGRRSGAGDLSEARATSRPAGRHVIRRRAKDAGDRPCHAGRPKLLLLDEPTEGVWIGVIEEITERLIDLAREIAVVIVEQHLDLALRVADYAYVLDRGRVALQGAAAEVRSDPELMRYLAP